MSLADKMANYDESDRTKKLRKIEKMGVTQKLQYIYDSSPSWAKYIWDIPARDSTKGQKARLSSRCKKLKRENTFSDIEVRKMMKEWGLAGGPNSKGRIKDEDREVNQVRKSLYSLDSR